MNSIKVKVLCYFCADDIGEVDSNYIIGPPIHILPKDEENNTIIDIPDQDIMIRTLYFLFHPRSGMLYNYSHPVHVCETRIKYFREVYYTDGIETVCNWIICEDCNSLCIDENTFDKAKTVTIIKNLNNELSTYKMAMSKIEDDNKILIGDLRHAKHSLKMVGLMIVFVLAIVVLTILAIYKL